MGCLSIPELIRWEELKKMATQWSDVLSRVRSLEEALGIPEPPCSMRHRREPRKGIMSGISLQDFDSFEELREINSEFAWVRSRLAAIAAKLDESAGVVRIYQRRRGAA